MGLAGAGGRRRRGSRSADGVELSAQLGQIAEQPIRPEADHRTITSGSAPARTTRPPHGKQPAWRALAKFPMSQSRRPARGQFEPAIPYRNIPNTRSRSSRRLGPSAPSGDETHSDARVRGKSGDDVHGRCRGSSGPRPRLNSEWAVRCVRGSAGNCRLKDLPFPRTLPALAGGEKSEFPRPVAGRGFG